MGVRVIELRFYGLRVIMAAASRDALPSCMMP